MRSGSQDVLIVEDDLPTREMYVYALTDAGYRVRAAHNGRQALDACLADPPALVVTDLRLPGLDGFALARELHAAFGQETPPVIAVTGFVPADNDPRLAQARFHRLLVKPVAPNLLLEAVKEALMGEVKNQPGHEPKQGNQREPGSPQQPDHSQHKDKEEPAGRASKGTGGKGTGS